jgi:hypothetical protein
MKQSTEMLAQELTVLCEKGGITTVVKICLDLWVRSVRGTKTLLSEGSQLSATAFLALKGLPSHL